MIHVHCNNMQTYTAIHHGNMFLFYFSLASVFCVVWNDCNAYSVPVILLILQQKLYGTVNKKLTCTTNEWMLCLCLHKIDTTPQVVKTLFTDGQSIDQWTEWRLKSQGKIDKVNLILAKRSKVTVHKECPATHCSFPQS